MNPLEQQLLDETLAGAKPLAVVRTDTRVDVGLWWRQRPLWLCVTPGELILLAVGRRRYCQRVALRECGSSFYSPASGELVIAPTKDIRFSRIKLPASKALSLLKLTRSQTSTTNTNPTTP